MDKAVVNKNVAELISRMQKTVSIQKMADIEPDKLAAFNIDLYRDQFNSWRYQDRQKILKFWEWKYRKNPVSKDIENFGWVAEHKGNLIGQLHIIPAEMKIGNDSYRVAWGSDLAILKEYRNLGISALLILHAKKEIGKMFTLFFIGGMNPNSYNILKKTGFTDISQIPRYIKILDIGAILGCYGVPGFLSSAVQKALSITGKILTYIKKHSKGSVSVEPLEKFDGEFEKFWNYVSSYYKCIAKRDISFLNWRYIDQPLWSYTILRAKRQGNMKCFAAVREGLVKNGRLMGKKIGIISDILIDPRDKKSAYELLNAIAGYFKDRKAILVKCDILNGLIENILRGTGFTKIKSQNGFIFTVCNERVSRGDIKLSGSGKNWFISSGDSDFDFD